MIEFRAAGFSYARHDEQQAAGTGVHDITLTVRPGEVLVLCGRSGCGKTTLTRLANGLAPSFFRGTPSGRVLLDGQDAAQLASWQIAERVGSVFQNPDAQFFTTDSTSEIAFCMESAGWPAERLRARTDEVIDELGLRELAGRSLFGLSGSQVQRIVFASAWAMRPGNLVLDEPTGNLDPGAVRELRDCVAVAKAAGCAVMVAEHRLSWLAGLADRYCVLSDGRIGRVLDADEFTALSDADVAALGLRARSADGIRPAPPPPGRGDGPDPPWLEATGLSVRRGGQQVLTGVDVRLRPGEVVAVTGANGAGKTTLGRTLCGLVGAGAGRVLVDGGRVSRRGLSRRAAMVFQHVEHQLFAETVDAEVTFGLARPQDVDVAGLLGELDLAGLGPRHPATLSGGQKQRLAVATAVAGDKRLVVLDEPTSGLDREAMLRVAALLRRLAAGRVVLVITHDLELIAAACDRLVHLAEGRIGAELDVRTDFARVRELFEDMAASAHRHRPHNRQRNEGVSPESGDG
ncbi:ABC transporter ATP-binding protein [Propionibacterium australiense]|uniref:ABC transporter n=1 Tax=Propionibacterium australiense TaxID=119981 RepID=A0A383S7H4_9ACTN|nr:ABC transporter ATP-binding protein [Propionibacterium australiense]RLP09726.1 ATP-binding cassette domain-containing protein [Propionibacterium australiense]SYZ33196.1 ABC transporter [Propionibacterium australiense]VEH89349.1 Putative HMP/thiamine import ATP-binding protein YkoD [Propionibacterium australiense]